MADVTHTHTHNIHSSLIVGHDVNTMGTSWHIMAFKGRQGIGRRKSVQADLGTIAKRCELMTEAMRSRTEAGHWSKTGGSHHGLGQDA